LCKGDTTKTLHKLSKASTYSACSAWLEQLTKQAYSSITCGNYSRKLSKERKLRLVRICTKHRPTCSPTITETFELLVLYRRYRSDSPRHISISGTTKCPIRKWSSNSNSAGLEFHSCGHEEYHFLTFNTVQSVEIQPIFRKKIRPLSSGSNNKSSRKPACSVYSSTLKMLAICSFFWNFGWLPTDYTDLHPRRQNS
jgi:hypothetical protein